MSDHTQEKTVKEDTRTFSLEINDSIASLVFCRPDKANSMNRQFWSEFPETIARLSNDPSVRVLVISAQGKNFCSGMDLSIFADGSLLNNENARSREKLRKLVLSLQATFNAIEELRIPVIVAIQGACIGGALDLVSACDLRFACNSAYFSIHETNLAMMADLGSLQRLPKWLPEGLVRELAYTGDRLTAERGEQFGFINQCFDSQDKMMEHAFIVARKIASKSPLAISATKEALNYARSHSIAESLAHTAVLQAAVLDLQDITVAARAQATKSDAEFAPVLAHTSL